MHLGTGQGRIQGGAKGAATPPTLSKRKFKQIKKGKKFKKRRKEGKKQKLFSPFHNLAQRSYNRVGIRLENPKVSHI